MQHLGAFSRSFSLITLVALLKAKPSKLGPKYVNLKYHSVSMAYQLLKWILVDVDRNINWFMLFLLQVFQYVMLQRQSRLPRTTSKHGFGGLQGGDFMVPLCSLFQHLITCTSATFFSRKLLSAVGFQQMVLRHFCHSNVIQSCLSVMLFSVLIGASCECSWAYIFPFFGGGCGGRIP